jgi:hypothetical protein
MGPDEGLQKQIELYRAMTAQRRLQISFELDALARQLARSGVRFQHPEWSIEQVEREVARRFRLAAGIPEDLPGTSRGRR